MANLTSSNLTNITSKFANSTVERESQNDSNTIVTIIVNSVACPFTVVLNALVIMAVKRRASLQSNANVLLSCLAVTDVLTGLTVQPSFILWKTLCVLGLTKFDAVYLFQNSSLRTVSVCSCLHLVLITCERLIAIKFTMRYPYIVTTRNIKLAVTAFWIFSLSFGALRLIESKSIFFNFLVALVLVSCFVFIASAYVILYFETLRHKKMIKNQQLPQEQVQRFKKENRALRTTVLIIGAVLVCFLPAVFALILVSSGVVQTGSDVYLFFVPWVRTFAMLNSLLNPLIYCWRQKEIRMLVFGCRTQAVIPATDQTN